MTPRVIALSGGVGGAKLALGLSKVVPDGELLIVANTGDDFEHAGFVICPDIDTLIYTLAGVCNPETGWGRADETWAFMESLRRERPEEAWFLLGDKDLETHRLRREWLQQGERLTQITARLARRLGVTASIVPMSDHRIRTHLLCGMPDGGQAWLAFQDYFVRARCSPPVAAVEFRGAGSATMSPALRAALERGTVEAVVICPSNPYLSIDPILAVPGLAQQLRGCGARVIAVSPVVGGRALKGPTVKMMRELGLATDVVAIARHYQGLIDTLVIDEADQDRRDDISSLGLEVLVTRTVMKTLDDKARLAREVLACAAGHSLNGAVVQAVE